MSGDNDPAIRVVNLTKTYRSGGAELVVFAGLNFEVARGEKLALVGESGTGKSTLMHLLGGLDRPTEGAIYFGQNDICSFSAPELAAFRNREVGFVWQIQSLLAEFTALENVMMPLLIRGQARDAAEPLAMSRLHEVGLRGRASHRAGELSGGEQQRVVLARALVGDPGVLLADEPTGNLDFRTGEMIMGVLEDLHVARQLTSVHVTHNLSFARRADRVLALERGRWFPPLSRSRHMFERYTEKARRSIFFARYEASMFGSPQIGTEHLLLGLVREDRALLGDDPPFESLRQWIEVHAGPRGKKISTSVDLPLSEECKSALMFGAEEAAKLGHEKIAPGHLLLGIVDQEGCLAAAALREFGMTPDALRVVVASKPIEVVSPEALTGLLGKARSHWGAVAALFSPPNRVAGQVYFRAQGEARKLGSPCLETKHLLLALVEGFDVKGCFGVDPAAVRERIRPEPQRREHVLAGIVPPTDELRQALAYAVEEAAQLGDKHFGPEHLVLGLLREEACEASEILRANGLSLDQARRAVAAFRNPGSGSEGSHYV